MKTAKRSPIAGHMVLQPIFSITENLSRDRKKYTRKNTPFKIKRMAALNNSSLVTDIYGALNNTIYQVQFNLNITYCATQYPPQIYSN